MSSLHTTLTGGIQNWTQKSLFILRFDLRKTRSGKSIDFSAAIVFVKLRLTEKAGLFKLFLLEKRFRKAPFSWRISVDS